MRAAGSNLQLASDFATRNHECTRIVLNERWHMKKPKKLMFREVRVPEAPSTRRGGCVPGRRETVLHAADDTKNRVATAALGRDAPPARRRQKWEPPS